MPTNILSNSMNTFRVMSSKCDLEGIENINQAKGSLLFNTKQTIVDGQTIDTVVYPYLIDNDGNIISVSVKKNNVKGKINIMIPTKDSVDKPYTHYDTICLYDGGKISSANIDAYFSDEQPQTCYIKFEQFPQEVMKNVSIFMSNSLNTIIEANELNSAKDVLSYKINMSKEDLNAVINISMRECVYGNRLYDSFYTNYKFRINRIGYVPTYKITMTTFGVTINPGSTSCMKNKVTATKDGEPTEWNIEHDGKFNIIYNADGTFEVEATKTATIGRYALKVYCVENKDIFETLYVTVSNGQTTTPPPSDKTYRIYSIDENGEPNFSPFVMFDSETKLNTITLDIASFVEYEENGAVIDNIVPWEVYNAPVASSKVYNSKYVQANVNQSIVKINLDPNAPNGEYIIGLRQLNENGAVMHIKVGIFLPYNTAYPTVSPESENVFYPEKTNVVISENDTVSVDIISNNTSINNYYKFIVLQDSTTYPIDCIKVKSSDNANSRIILTFPENAKDGENYTIGLMNEHGDKTSLSVLIRYENILELSYTMTNGNRDEDTNSDSFNISSSDVKELHIISRVNGKVQPFTAFEINYNNPDRHLLAFNEIKSDYIKVSKSLNFDSNHASTYIIVSNGEKKIAFNFNLFAFTVPPMKDTKNVKFSIDNNYFKTPINKEFNVNVKNEINGMQERYSAYPVSYMSTEINNYPDRFTFKLVNIRHNFNYEIIEVKNDYNMTKLITCEILRSNTTGSPMTTSSPVKSSVAPVRASVANSNFNMLY